MTFCYVDKCCCGCISHENGVILWAILDIIAQLLLLCPFLLFDFVGWNVTLSYMVQTFFVPILDLVLAFGTFCSCKGMIIVWLILKLVSMFGPLIAVMATIVEEQRIMIDILIIVTIEFSINTYFWIVVNSLRKKISDQSEADVPQESHFNNCTVSVLLVREPSCHINLH